MKKMIANCADDRIHAAEAGNSEAAGALGKLYALRSALRDFGSAAVAFSAGVDSTFLLRVAHEALNDRVVAVTARSRSFPAREIDEAAAFCRAEGVRHVILDSEDNLVAFGITIPDISKALQKAKGHLFPFGWFYLLRALKNAEVVDMMLNGAVPSWQHTGISSILHTIIGNNFATGGTKVAITNPQIESNGAINVWNRYPTELHMRRRCYLKQL